MPIVIPMTDSNTYSDGLMPIGEAARALGVSIGTIRNWDRDGKLSSTRTLGGQRRFRASDVDAIRNGQAA